jgi:hypothetical protein
MAELAAAGGSRECGSASLRSLLCRLGENIGELCLKLLLRRYDLYVMAGDLRLKTPIVGQNFFEIPLLQADQNTRRIPLVNVKEILGQEIVLCVNV